MRALLPPARPPAAYLACLVLSFAPAACGADAPPRRDAPQTKESREEAFDRWLKDDGELMRQWHELFYKALNLPDDSPEKEALDAEMARISAARKALREGRGPAVAGAAEPEAAAAEDDGAAKPLARLPGTNGTAVAFSRDGARLLVAGGIEARVWDAKTFKPLGKPLAHGAGVWAASFSPDGGKVVTAGGKDARIWDAATGEPLATLTHPADARCAAFSPDGSRVATGCEDKRVRLWDAATGKPVEAAAMEHVSGVRFVDFVSDGKLLLSADLWRRNADDPRQALEAPAGVSVRAWDARTGGQKWSHAARGRFHAISGVALSHDRRKVIVLDKDWRQAVLVDAVTGAVEVRLEKGEGPDFDHPAFSPDGSRVAIAGWGEVHLWDTATGKRLADPIGGDVRDGVTRLQFTPDGKRLLVCARSGRFGIDSQLAGLWDVEARRKVFSFPCGEVASGSLSPDGSRAAIGCKATRGSETTVWDLPKHAPALADAAPADAAPRTIAGKLPPRDSPDWSDVFEWFNDSRLPKDLPLPATTPFDNAPAARDQYHSGYRLGLVCGLQSAGMPDGFESRPAAFQRGLKAGEVAGHKLHTLRQKADSARRFDYSKPPHGRLVTADGPEEERKVLDSFQAFAGAFERALRATYPEAVIIEIPGTPRLYSHTHDDYSRDNTGKARRVRAFKGVLDSRRPGNSEWMVVRPRDPALPGALGEELQGRYGFKLDYDPTRGRWGLETDPHQENGEEGVYTHMQQVDVAGRMFRSRASKAAREMILKAVKDAQPRDPA